MQIYQQSSGKIPNSTRSMAEPHKLWLVALLKIFLQLLSCFFFTRAHLQPHRLLPAALPQLSFPFIDSDLCQDQNNKCMQTLTPSTFSIWRGFFLLYGSILYFHVNNCCATLSSLPSASLFWFRAGSCIEYCR